MRPIKTDPKLKEIEERIVYHAGQFERTLPEMRFFILDGLEFASLLEKKVYPTSPVNIWEGKRMITKKYRIETGQESSLYYEVVQTGNPSYAYLNSTNSPMMQATVMAHVAGHCEFSELNVLQDSSPDRTEKVMYLVKKVNLGRRQMGDRLYRNYWNAAESAVSLMAPNSQYNLARSVETDKAIREDLRPQEKTEEEQQPYQPFSSTLEKMLRSQRSNAFEIDQKTRQRQETLSRHGYKLKSPCQDVLGFLREFAPSSKAERSVLDYMYVVHQHQDFVIRTQIMNEGWAMYWEKKIMLELFKERVVDGIIDYAKVFSGVCYPRPYYMRNPYHLGYHLWCHIEELYRKGKVNLDFHEEVDREVKNKWDRSNGVKPLDAMGHLVRTVTDYEFLRRFLTPELIHEFHLNRIPQRDVLRLGISKREIIQENKYWAWLDPEPIKMQMLNFFTHYYRPRIYIIDTDFEDGGLLLFHRDDGRRLKSNWIRPTLRNLNLIWKAGVSLISKGMIYSFKGGRYKEMRVLDIEFEEVVDRISQGKKPVTID